MDIRFTDEAARACDVDGVIFFVDTDRREEELKILKEQLGERSEDLLTGILDSANGDVRILPAFNMPQKYVLLVFVPSALEREIDEKLLNFALENLVERVIQYGLISLSMDFKYLKSLYQARAVSFLKEHFKSKRERPIDLILYLSQKE